MAACGINEHKEGCRKQRVIDRAAAAKCMKLAGIERPAVRECDPDDPEALGFMRKCGSPPGITGNFGPSLDAAPSYRNGLLDMEGQHSPTAIDRLPRMTRVDGCVAGGCYERGNKICETECSGLGTFEYGGDNRSFRQNMADLMWLSCGDELRREGVWQQQLVTYSAKVPNRLSSINYTQQW